jgi:hypothetical protein
MRLLITGLIIIIGTFGRAFSQDVVFGDTTVLLPKTETCDKARIKANNDAKSNILKISRGPMYGDEYERFYRNYMVTKFGIEVVGRGCLIYDFEECYNAETHKIIHTKYGDNFLVKTEDEIKKEFEVFKTLDKEQRKKYINFDFTYKIVDHKADYIEGHKNLIKELHKRIDFSKLDFKGRTIFLYLVIGQTGTVDKCEIISKGPSGLDTEKIEKTIRGLHWTPARLYGFDIKSEKIIGIPTTME